MKSGSESALATAFHFGSSESANPPRLLIDYTTPPPAPILTNTTLQAGALTLHFDPAPGWFYRVESRTNVDHGAWTTVTNVPAGAALNPITISLPAISPERFYRLVPE